MPLSDPFPAAGAHSPAALQETRSAVASASQAHGKSPQVSQAERRYLRALRAEKLLAAGLPLPPADLDPALDANQLAAEREPALAAMNALEPGLQAFEDLQ